MTHKSLLTIAVAIAGSVPASSECVEYWWDSARDASMTVPVVDGVADITDFGPRLSPAPHILFMQVVNSEGMRGPISQFFAIGDLAALRKATAVEYWWDNNRSAKRSVPISNGLAEITDFGPTLSPGAHILFMQVLNTDGTRGPISQFFAMGDVATLRQASVVEYWWDHDRSTAMSVPVTNGLAEITDFGAPLGPGLHTLFMQPLYTDGRRGPTHQLFVPVIQAKKDAAGFEYWLDDLYDSRTFLATESGEASFTIDLQDTDPGIHLLSVRPLMKDGSHGALWQRIIVNTPRQTARVAAYRYSINNVTGTVPAQQPWTPDQVLTLPLPETDALCDPASGRFNTDGNRLSLMAGLGTTIVLTPILESGHPMASITETVDLDGSIDRTAIPLAMNRKVALTTPRGELYEAIVMEFDDVAPAYLRPSAACSLRILDANGADVVALQAAAGETVSFLHKSTKYFAVVHHADDAAPAEIDLKLMALPNRVPAPSIAFEAGTVTLGCDDPEATIRYTLDDSEPTAESAEYTGPFDIDRNYPIRAVATVGDMDDSDIARHEPAYFRVEPMAMSYNGRYLTLTNPREGAEIKYALDGGEPTTYSGTIDLPGISAVTAHAEYPYLLDSEELSFTPKYHYDGATATLTAAGRLADAFEWSGTDAIESLAVNGNVNDADFATMRSIASLRSLDLSGATPDGASLPAGALASTALHTVSLPAALTGAGNGIVRDTPQLTSLRWNASTPLTAAMLAEQGNPNLLVYVADKGLAPTSQRNVIDGGLHSDLLQLSAGYPFECPESFTAAKASYTRTFGMTSGMGECAGWETITLPFNVNSFTMSDTGTECAPFATDGSYTLRPFWLYALDENGWRAASTILAHEPYIISLPNNDAYIDGWSLSGPMTFAAENVRIEATEPMPSTNGLRTLTPSFRGENADGALYVLNAYDDSGEYAPGSVFLPGWGDVKPFECYFTAKDSPQRISIFGDILGLEDVFGDRAGGSLVCRVENGALYVLSDRDRTVRVVNTTGAVVRTASLTAGEEARIDGLVHGFYMVENIKICIR